MGAGVEMSHCKPFRIGRFSCSLDISVGAAEMEPCSALCDTHSGGGRAVRVSCGCRFCGIPTLGGTSHTAPGMVAGLALLFRGPPGSPLREVSILEDPVELGLL